MRHTPNKLLGQNFLKPTCGWVAEALVSAAGLHASDIVLEIGPGTGALTRILAKHSSKVIAIEKDRALVAELTHTLADEGIINVTIITGDILTVLSERESGIWNLESGLNPNSKFEILNSKHKVVANIPYYLTARLIRVLLESDPQPECIVITIQKEVAERIIARPPHMSLLALSVQTYGTPKIVAAVPPDCFSPPPKVHSSILQIIPHKKSFFEETGIGREVFFGITRKAFQQKRKKLSTSLQLKNSSLAHTITEKRPEALSLEEWTRVIEVISKPEP